MTPRVSIIVPVYNTEQYIPQCLDSLINQTLNEIEIICVDNGSTDDSLKILKEYEAKNREIKVLLHSEGRQGAARNAGMKVANGTYIGFVDSDDFVEIDMFERMFSESQLHDTDIAICNINLFFQKTNKKTLHLPEQWFEKKVFTSDDIGLFFRNLTICNKLFRRKFLEKNSIYFPEEYYHEDQVFVIKAYTRTKKIVGLKQPFYNYRKQRDGSVSQHQGRSCFDIFPIMQILERYFNGKEISNHFEQILSEIKILKTTQIIQTVEEKYRKEFFLRMHNEFIEIETLRYRSILTNSEYKEFLIIRNGFYRIFLCKKFMYKLFGKAISYPVLGHGYRVIKSIFVKKGVV